MRFLHLLGVIIVLLMPTNGFTFSPVVNGNNQIEISTSMVQPRAGPETIVINEFMPDPNSDWDGDMVYVHADDEWVELYNYGPSPVDISGWNISDATAKRYSFPPGTIVPVGGYYVAFGSNHSLTLSNTGDTVKLLNATDVIIDSHSYTSSYNDISIGRLPDGSTNWTEFYEPTPGRSNGNIPKIVINEIMYDPSGSDTENEWLELFNNDTKAFNITYWELSDQDGDVDYIFNSIDIPNMVFPPQKYLLIHSGTGTDELDFSDNVGNLYMSRTSAMLNNDGDDVLLTDRGGLCIDYMAYGKSMTIDPPPRASTWDGTWYNNSADEYNSGLPNPSAESDSSVRLTKNGQDTNSVSDWSNASGVEVSAGRNNNEIIGLDVIVDKLTKYINTSESALFNISISNPGNLLLNLKITISEASNVNGWAAQLSESSVDLFPKTGTNITLTITSPADVTKGNEFKINLSIKATNVNLKKNLTLTTIIPAVDFEITKFEIDDSITKTTINEGEIVYLKATIKNLGIIDGSTFNVDFYYDQVDQNHLLGSKEYDYIYAENYKYPSLKWDTLGFHGNYTLIVIADIDDDIVEPDEVNNRFECNISVLDTSPSALEKHLLITEVYYDTKTSYEPNEFIRIYNPTNEKLDITGWQLTDDPEDDSAYAIGFPANTWLEPKQMIYITEEAEPFLSELGFEPDFACEIGPLKDVKLLENTQQWPGFSNSGDLVVLRDDFRHIIDLIAYGNADPTSYTAQWQGGNIPLTSEGKILKRQRDLRAAQGDGPIFLDTNSAIDWHTARSYGIGQSDFYPQTFDFSGEVIPFVSPENSLHTMIKEIESAKNSIYLNVYEFTHPTLAEYLLNALDRGVDLKILNEGNPVGWNFSNVDDPTYKKDEEYSQKYLLTQLYNAGAEIKFLSYIKNDHKNQNIYKRYNYNHAKYTIIDDETLIILSGNWKPTSVPEDVTFGNREWGVVIKNTTIAEYFKEVFEADWVPISDLQNDTHFYDLTSNVYGPPPEFFQINYTTSSNWYEPLEISVDNSITGDFSIEPVLSPDTSERADSAIIGMINDAKESVYIQQMDCNLDWLNTHSSSNDLTINWSDPEHYYLNWADGNQYHNEYLTAAIDAAKRGCQVRILLDSRYVEPDVGPWKTYKSSVVDNLDTVQYINKLAALDGLTNNLEARLSHLSGLEKVHNKGVIVDANKVLVSSINWNYNSVSNNREAGVIIENNEVADYYYQFFDLDWSLAKSINEPTLPNASEQAILITEFYADTYLPYDPDEYIAITNPTTNNVDISGWMINDKLTKYIGYEGVLVFPVNTWIESQQTLYITRNASTFYHEHAFLPDFEYIDDSLPRVPQLELLDSSSGSSIGPQFANKGDEIVLADEYLFSDIDNEYLHIIDMVVYGNTSYITDPANITYPFNTSHWYGRSIYNVTEGEILKRNLEEKSITGTQTQEFLDTNSAPDWENNRIYHPGQSDFEFNTISYSGSVTAFTSPDSSYETIVTELDKARSTIFFSIYQFHYPHLMDRLINASERGVDVKVFIDGAPVGGITDTAQYVAQQLVASGCEVRFMRSISSQDIHRRYRFVHTKYLVIDNFTTILISENWKSTGIPVDNTYGNRGWGVVVRNAELANDYAQVFFHDWNPARGDSYAFNASDDRYGDPPEDFLMSWSVQSGDYKPRFDSKTINGEFKVTPVIAPDTTFDTYGSILEMINSAESSVYIEQLNCYIDWDTKNRDIDNLYLSAAIAAAKRGCEVRILLDSAFASEDNPGLDNYDTVEYINSISQQENLTDHLQAKLIYLDGYQGKNRLEKVHNKGIIVDGKKTLVSSINWATGSVINNREAGVIIENSKVADFYTEIFNYDWNLTVHEYLETYVLHSDTREISAGESTEYVISFINTQPTTLTVNLSLAGLDATTGWDAELDQTSLTLLPAESLSFEPVEIQVTVTAPTQEELNQFKNSPNSKSSNNSYPTLELFISAETRGMATEIIFTTTNVLESTDADGDAKEESEKPMDRSMVDPWLVVILLAIMLIVGAVMRDLIKARLDKKKKKEKVSERSNGRVSKPYSDDEELEE